MERNQNGYPTQPRDSRTSDGCAMDGGASLEDRLLAYAYVPIEKWRMLYSPEQALLRGTLFEELDKPMEVYGRE